MLVGHIYIGVFEVTTPPFSDSLPGNLRVNLITRIQGGAARDLGVGLYQNDTLQTISLENKLDLLTVWTL